MQNFDQISVEKPEQPYKFEDENYKQNENQPEIVKLSKLETIDDVKFIIKCIFYYKGARENRA